MKIRRMASRFLDVPACGRAAESFLDKIRAADEYKDMGIGMSDVQGQLLQIVANQRGEAHE